MKLTIFLAGAYKADENIDAEWRDKATLLLKQAADNVGADVNVINPLLYYPDGNVNFPDVSDSHRQAKSFYTRKIRSSDLVLVNLEDTAESVGSGQEVQFAVDHGIPVIGFNAGANSYRWIEEVDCEVAKTTLIKAVDYIRDYYMI